jgi:hypothetical protein
MVKYLLDQGLSASSVSGDGFHAIHLCSSVEIWQLLMDYGADPKALTSAGADALKCALLTDEKYPHVDLVTHLLDKGVGAKSYLEEVQELDLRNMYRDNVPIWIGKLPNLKLFLVAEGNELSSLPQNVVDGGDEKILAYLKDFSSGTKDTWQTFKVLVLGKEGVGKTHIFHKVTGKDYKKNISTDGIDIHPVTFGKDLKVTWFDFGGQVCAFFNCYFIFIFLNGKPCF